MVYILILGNCLREGCRRVVDESMHKYTLAFTSNFLICVSKMIDIFKFLYTMGTVKHVGNPNGPPASSQSPNHVIVH